MSEYNYIFDGNRPPDGFVLVAEAYHRAGKEIYPEQWGNLILHFTEEGAVFFKETIFRNLMNSIFLGIDESGRKNLWDDDTAKLTFMAFVREGIKNGTVKRALDKFELLIQKYPDINRKQARWESLVVQCNNVEDLGKDDANFYLEYNYPPIFDFFRGLKHAFMPDGKITFSQNTQKLEDQYEEKIQAVFRNLFVIWDDIKSSWTAVTEILYSCFSRLEKVGGVLLGQLRQSENLALLHNFETGEQREISVMEWNSDRCGIYLSPLNVRVPYLSDRDCDKLKLPYDETKGGKWAVLVSEDVLCKPDNSGDIIEKDDMYLAIERFHKRARELREENPLWTQEQIWDEMEKDHPPHKGKKVWGRDVYARICTGEYPAAKRRGFGPIFSS